MENVSNELILDVSASEVSIALLENKRLVELHKERSNLQFSVGDIYLGKVKKIMPGLNAAFIDVGYEKDAFLHYLDLGPQFQSLHKYLDIALGKKGRIPAFQKFGKSSSINKEGKITEVLTSGQTVMVQIAKEPISTKGPRLSSEISLAGRNLVLMPFGDKVSVSHKIESAEERQRLRTLITSIKPKNYGVIVRTVAEGKKVATLDAELRELVERWEKAFEKLRGSTPPKLVLGEINRTSAILRDLLNVSFSSVHVNDESIYNEIVSYIESIAPEKKKIVKLYKGNKPVFEHFGVEKQIKSLFGKTVSFKNGAYLIIEHTEALHVIDVNSGNRSKTKTDQETNALEVNLAAVEEISRQLRLRDMGGIIVTDFIDMQTAEHKQQVFDRMKKVMESDRTKHNILPLSKFGLMQITRQRVRPEMNIDTSEKCPTCNGTGKMTSSLMVLEEIETNLQHIVEHYKIKNIVLKVHPFIGSYLTKGWLNPMYRQWGRKYGCKLSVQSLFAYQMVEYHFFTANDEEILL